MSKTDFRALCNAFKADSRARKARVLAVVRAARRDEKSGWTDLQRQADQMTGVVETLVNTSDPSEAWEDVIGALSEVHGLDIDQAMEDYDSAEEEDEYE